MYLYTHLDPCCHGVLNLSFSGTINSIPGMLYILLSAAISIWFHLYILFEFFPIIKKNSRKMNMHLLCLSDGEGNGNLLQYSCLEKSHGRRSLVGCRPWGREESDTTEWLHFHFSLSCIGEGNGNPFQGPCLENPRDGRAWWAAVYGVAQSRTRLKRLSSSSSSTYLRKQCFVPVKCFFF